MGTAHRVRLTYEQLSGRLDTSGLGWRFAITVLPTHLFVLGAMRRVIVALRLKITEFQATDPELSVPAQLKAWTTSSAARAANLQRQLGEKRALTHALQTNGANPDDIARVVAEIRAMEEHSAQSLPPVERTLQEVLGALARKRAELGVLRRNGAPEAAVAAASASVAELRGRLVELGASLAPPA